jgi:hypothetical protein
LEHFQDFAACHAAGEDVWHVAGGVWVGHIRLNRAVCVVGSSRACELYGDSMHFLYGRRAASSRLLWQEAHGRPGAGEAEEPGVPSAERDGGSGRCIARRASDKTCSPWDMFLVAHLVSTMTVHGDFREFYQGSSASWLRAALFSRQ